MSNLKEQIKEEPLSLSLPLSPFKVYLKFIINFHDAHQQVLDSHFKTNKANSHEKIIQSNIIEKTGKSLPMIIKKKRRYHLIYRNELNNQSEIVNEIEFRSCDTFL